MKLLKLIALWAGTLMLTACPPSSPTPDANTPKAITVHWFPGEVYPIAVQYRVYRSNNGSTYGSPRVVLQPSLSLVDSNVLPNRTYWYYVTAYNAATLKESARSNVASCTVPCPAAVSLTLSQPVTLNLPTDPPPAPSNVFVSLPTLNQIGSANGYCKPDGTWIGSATDGPATLPRQCMNTAMSNTPSSGVTHGPFTTFSALQAAVNAGACGDKYFVQMGSDLGLVTLNLPAKNCPDTAWNLIESTGVSDPRFPAEGTRMTPCWSGKAAMPNRNYPCPAPANLTFKIAAANASNAIAAQSGGDHWRIIGAYVTRDQSGGKAIYNLVDLGSQNKTNAHANHVILDRFWFDGVEFSGPATVQSADTSTTRAIYLAQANHVAVIDSYFTNFYDTTSMSANGNTDAQCISGGNGGFANSGWGVYKFVNNHCEASGEGILLGGSGGPQLTPAGCTVMVNCNLDVPTDLEVRSNYFFKPPQWNGNTTTVGGTGWPVVKNGFEMKIGARALFEGNVIENVWYSAQVGWCWTTAPKNQSGGSPLHGTAPTALTNDFTYRYNYCYNAAYGIGLYQSMDSGCTGCQAQGANRISIHDNVIGDNLNLGSLSSVSSGDGSSFTADGDSTGAGLNQINNVSFSHNTLVKALRAGFGFGASAPGQFHNWTIQDNIFPYGIYGVIANPSSGGCTSTADNSNKFWLLLTGCVTGWTADHNALFDLRGIRGAGWPTDGNGLGNFFYCGTATWTNCASPNPITYPGFTNYGTGDSGFNPSNYRILTSSPLHNAGSDGKDVGADIATLTTAIAGVRE